MAIVAFVSVVGRLTAETVFRKLLGINAPRTKGLVPQDGAAPKA